MHEETSKEVHTRIAIQEEDIATTSLDIVSHEVHN